MATVIVYAFTTPHRTQEGKSPKHVKATRGTIGRMKDAFIIESSAEEVEESKLDNEGLYHPKP